MKHSIEWHKECLANRKRTAASNRSYAERKIASVERLEQENNLRQAQIDLAIKEGKDGFDPDKYAIKRLCV